MKFVAYYRVSTKRQGMSGLGLEAQKEAVASLIRQTGGTLIASYREVESGRKDNRAMLQAALADAKKAGAKLVVAKLDRLGRRASYILRLIDESGVDFHICDMPNADKLTITILAAVAEREAEAISQRTKAALAVAKARGTVLGNPTLTKTAAKGRERQVQDKRTFALSVMPVIEQIRTKGKVTSHLGIAQALNARGIKTARDGSWTNTTVRRVIEAAKAA